MKQKYRIDTRLTHLASSPREHWGFVNPPSYRGSTVLYDSVRTMNQQTSDTLRRSLPSYGRFGTPTCRALEDAFAELEGGYAAICTSCGLSAITTAILGFVEAGDHILVSDSVYVPTRSFCNKMLSKLGIETEYYDPRIGREIASLVRPTTRLIFMESPGTATFEVQDVPAITGVARERGVITMIDNTWSTPLFFRPLEHSVDVSIHSASKYITGSADSLLGIIVCNESSYEPVRKSSIAVGQYAGADDVLAGLRGLRTLAVRLRRHQEQAMALCEWLRKRPEVETIIYPALPEHPDHELWKRDFDGASGLFSVVLKAGAPLDFEAMLDGMEIFGLGHGYGGYESLIVPVQPGEYRHAPRWQAQQPLLRIHAGFEDLADLQADLEAGFQRLLHST